MNKTIVYRTENKLNGKFYYGVMSLGKNKASSYLGSGVAINRAISKYGRDNFIRRTIKEFDTPDEAYSFEALIVDNNFVDRRDCYNMKPGGLGSTGFKWSEESKKKASETHIRIGTKPPTFKNHTEESKAKISNSHKGRSFSDEHRRKLSEAAKKRGMKMLEKHYKRNENG